MGGKYAALMVAAGLTIFAASGAHADSSRIVKIQAALDAWLADRSLPEKVTGRQEAAPRQVPWHRRIRFPQAQIPPSCA